MFNPNVIFWGDGSRRYTPARSTPLWLVYNLGLVQADFNDDGWTDLGSVEDRYALRKPETLHAIYLWYGGPDGFREDRRAVLLLQVAGSGVRAADLNRDGFLDLVAGAGEPNPDGPIGLVVFYGSRRGFSVARREILPIGVKGRRRRLPISTATAISISPAAGRRRGSVSSTAVRTASA